MVASNLIAFLNFLDIGSVEMSIFIKFDNIDGSAAESSHKIWSNVKVVNFNYKNLFPKTPNNAEAQPWIQLYTKKAVL